MTALDLVGHIGYVSLFVGSQLLARHNKYGWLCRLLGELIWVVLGFILGLTSIWMWGIFFVFANDIYGFWKWSKAEKKPRRTQSQRSKDWHAKCREIGQGLHKTKKESSAPFPTYFRTATPDDIKQIVVKVHEIAKGRSYETDPDLLEPKGKRVTQDRFSCYDQDAARKRRGGLGRSPAPRHLIDPETLTREKLAVMKTWYPELLKKTEAEKIFERLGREGDSKW